MFTKVTFLPFSLQKEQLESELVEKSQIIDTMSEQLSQYRTGMLNKSDEEKLFEELQANYDLLETGNSKLRQDLYMTMKEKEHLRLKLRKDYDQIVASLKLELEQSRAQNLEKERFIHNQRVEIQSLVGDKDSLIAKLKEKSGVTNEDLQRSGDVQPNVDEVTELKNEINLLRKECQDCRMEKDKLFNKFHETAESLRSELEKSFDEKANLTQKSEEALNQNRELQQSLLEKQSALTKAKLQFEHIGKGWRNDLEAARAEKEELLRRLGSQVICERVSKNVSTEKSALLEFYTSGVNLIKLFTSVTIVLGSEHNSYTCKSFIKLTPALSISIIRKNNIVPLPLKVVFIKFKILDINIKMLDHSIRCKDSKFGDCLRRLYCTKRLNFLVLG